MKKTFELTAENKNPERQVDSVKHEIKKYLGRERRKKLPEGYDVWNFDCKIGESAESAQTINVSDISAKVDAFVSDSKESFYLEIHAKADNKPNKK